MSKKNKTYYINKEAAVGDTITCPVCCITFIKKQYSQAFCCKECKDKFWNKKGDRHSKGYYSDYNMKHPERLDRGYTKGYNNGNVSDGVKEKRNTNIWYDSLGRAYSRDFYNPTMTDMINQREYGTWHDDDWCEND